MGSNIPQGSLSPTIVIDEIDEATLVTSSETIASNINDTTIPTSKAVHDSVVTKTESLLIFVNDETTTLTTGTAKTTFRMPYAFNITDVRASLTTAGTGVALVTVDINETGVSILSTKITIDATEKTSTTAAIPAVISDAAIADDAEITVDIDLIDTGAVSAGLKIYLIGNQTSA